MESKDIVKILLISCITGIILYIGLTFPTCSTIEEKQEFVLYTGQIYTKTIITDGKYLQVHYIYGGQTSTSLVLYLIFEKDGYPITLYLYPNQRVQIAKTDYIITDITKSYVKMEVVP